MAVKIKLMRMGKIRAPYYRIIVADSRTKRDGRAIEEIGKYHPTEEPSRIELDSERAQYWLSVGAQPTEPVAAILRITGDWQKFRGEPGAEGTLRVAQPKADKKSVFEAAAKETAQESKDGATTPRKRAAKKAATAAAEGTPTADRPTADEAAAEGDPRAAGSADGTSSASTAAGETPESPAASSDDAAKAAPGSAQGAPAVEETTAVPDTDIAKSEG